MVLGCHEQHVCALSSIGSVPIPEVAPWEQHVCVNNWGRALVAALHSVPNQIPRPPVANYHPPRL